MAPLNQTAHAGDFSLGAMPGTPHDVIAASYGIAPKHYKGGPDMTTTPATEPIGTVIGPHLTRDCARVNGLNR